MGGSQAAWGFRWADIVPEQRPSDPDLDTTKTSAGNMQLPQVAQDSHRNRARHRARLARTRIIATACRPWGVPRGCCTAHRAEGRPCVGRFCAEKLVACPPARKCSKASAWPRDLHDLADGVINGSDPEPRETDKSNFQPEAEGRGVKYGLPSNVEYCTRCVISNQRPNSAVEYEHKDTTRRRPSPSTRRVSATPAGSPRRSAATSTGRCVRSHCTNCWTVIAAAMAATTAWCPVRAARTASTRRTCARSSGMHPLTVTWRRTSTRSGDGAIFSAGSTPA